MHKRRFSTLSWITNEGHAAKTADISGISGKVVRVDVSINSVTASGVTTNVTLKDVTNSGYTNYVNLASFTGAAEDTVTTYVARSHKSSNDADFNEIPCSNSTLRVSVDPSADPAGSAQTLNVIVDLYLEED